MKYFPVTNESEAQAISSLIYDLTRPAGSDISDTTKYSIGWQFDRNGACYLCVDQSFELPVHKDRDGAIVTALRGLQAAGKLSKASADNIIALAAANVGKAVTVGQVCPAEWLAVAVDAIELPASDSPGE
jgi:hypothetical protein